MDTVGRNKKQIHECIIHRLEEDKMRIRQTGKSL